MMNEQKVQKSATAFGVTFIQMGFPSMVIIDLFTCIPKPETSKVY